MSKVKFKFDNGDVLRDKVTNFEGVVMVCAEYSTGCHHYGIQSRELKAQEMQEWVWLDQSRLVRVRKNVVSFDVDPENTSGAFPSGPMG